MSARHRPGAPLAVGLVGCGRLAEAGYVPAPHAARGVRLVAVADPDPSRRAQVARLAGVGGFPGAPALVEGAAVDAVVLATPAPAHVADARLATDAGLAVLVEKPPAPDGAGAAALAALDPAPWIGFNRRFDPGMEALRDGVPAEGRLELLVELRYRRRSWGAHANGDDALLDLGPHLADLARWICGNEATAVDRATVAHDHAEVHLDLAQARATLRAAADRPHLERVEVRGEGGTVLARHRRGGLIAGVRGRLAPRGGPHPLVGSLAVQLEAFALAARGGPAPSLGTAADGVAAMAVLGAARASALGSSPVPVPVAV